MIDFIKEIMDTPLATSISFISMIFFIISSLLWIIKGTKIFLRELKLRNKLRLAIIIVLFILCGLIAPTFVLIKSFSDWTGILLWISQIISWYVLSVFLSATIFVIKFEISVKRIKPVDDDFD